MQDKKESLKKATLAAHDTHDERHYGAVSFPIYQNSLFSFSTTGEFDEAFRNSQTSYIYTRGNNPTVEQFERRLAEMEGGEKARCFASGMAAISSAIMSVIEKDAHIVCVDQAYGPARELMGRYLARFGVETTFVNGSRVEEIAGAIRPNTCLLYLESPTSLFFQLQDIRQCVRLAQENGITTIMDNTWATPIFQNPLKLGVDLVVHSLTKYISGHSDALGGVVIGSRERIEKISAQEYALFGALMTPQTASLMMRGLRTLPLRMEQHQRSALQVAEFLEALPFIRRVNYPALVSHPQHDLSGTQMDGCSSLLSFEWMVAYKEAQCWADHLEFFRIGVSWGGFESLVIVNRLPQKREDEPGVVVRLHIGLEDPNDLIEDLKQAFPI